MKKVCIIAGNFQYDSLFKDLGYALTHILNEAQLVCFTGGEDVTPGVYGDTAHKYTGNNPFRDNEEAKIVAYCVRNDIPMVGICRGAQFLNVMGGGRMYQHVERHCGNHEITDARTGQKLLVSSTHHQMMMPAPSALLVATAALGGSREWYDGDRPRKDVSDMDIEAVYYENINALCFQPHPEFPGYPDMREYFKSLVKEFCHA